MKLKVLISALILSLTIPAIAESAVIEEAYEVALSDLRLPGNAGGTLAFKECESCDFVTLRVNSGTQYQLNGKAISLDKFRLALSQIENQNEKAVTVLHNLKQNQVTAVSVYN